jgi:hypothetical protein
MNDIPGILALQEPNLVERAGGLAVRQTAGWFRHAILEKSIVVSRRNGKVVGYVLGTSLAAKAHDDPGHVACFPGITRLLSVRSGLRGRS